jgi:pimeloyl-ACP methyl ester carboxylesterase
VLFVHGITGFPAQFSDLLDSLDRDRYQAWFFNYPSGFYLPTIGEGLYRVMEQIRRRLGFKRLHLIAHSMGGLVAQSYVQNCQEEAACEYLETFISIASPFNGMDSAKSGVEYAPEVVPSWRDLAPGSDFLETLFERPLPASARHYLMFTYHLDRSFGDMVSVESSDGVVPLRSQLRHEAQNQAKRVAGFDQTHVGVLSDPALLETITGILSSRDE